MSYSSKPNVTTFPALTVRDVERLTWLRGRVEAELAAACTTGIREPWLCDSQTAARLSFVRWLFITGQVSES